MRRETCAPPPRKTQRDALVITPAGRDVKQRCEYDAGVVMEAVKALSSEEITELCLRHTLYDWSTQAGLKPLPVTGAKGVHFHTADGRRFLDFNSQLMSVNAGHGDRRIIEAIKRQAETLPYISPFMAHEARARLGARLASLLPATSTRCSSPSAERSRTR